MDIQRYFHELNYCNSKISAPVYLYEDAMGLKIYSNQVTFYVTKYIPFVTLKINIPTGAIKVA